MTSDDLIETLASAIRLALVGQIIQAMQAQACTASDDSGLANAWEEYCVQIQDGQWPQFDLYEATMGPCLVHCADLLPPTDKALFKFDSDGTYEQVFELLRDK